MLESFRAFGRAIRDAIESLWTRIVEAFTTNPELNDFIRRVNERSPVLVTGRLRGDGVWVIYWGGDEQARIAPGMQDDHCLPFMQNFILKSIANEHA